MKTYILILLFIILCIPANAQTLAQKNNNPVNLKAFVQWDGMIGKDKYGHAMFESLDYGTRAAIKNAQTRQRRRPNQTLKQWMNDFAEENGDHESDYIASNMGISTDAKLNDINMYELVIHQAWFEGRIKITKKYVNEIKEKFNL